MTQDVRASLPLPAGTPLAQPVALPITGEREGLGDLKQVPAYCSITTQLGWCLWHWPDAGGSGEPLLCRRGTHALLKTVAGETQSPFTSTVQRGLLTEPMAGEVHEWDRSTGQGEAMSGSFSGLSTVHQHWVVQLELRKTAFEAIYSGFRYDF